MALQLTLGSEALIHVLMYYYLLELIIVDSLIIFLDLFFLGYYILIFQISSIILWGVAVESVFN